MSEPTGNDAVDAALAELVDVGELSPAEQLATLATAHEALHQILTVPSLAPEV